MNRFSIQTMSRKFATAPNLYGLFFEDINRAGDGGLYPELLRNRSFEDSIPPPRSKMAADGKVFTTATGWQDQFNHGEGLDRWIRERDIPETSIPAWYANGAQMELDSRDRLNDKRLVSLRVRFSGHGAIWNTGYAGIPVRQGGACMFYMFAKAAAKPAQVAVSLQSAAGEVYAQSPFQIRSQEYERYEAVLWPSAEDDDARLVITAEEEAWLNIGFISLMPADTFRGHGLRKDLAEKLSGLNGKFLRFPGGCIVEGISWETAMRFSNTIGPVWERPSQQLMWHYRASNGLGYHEYLQLCEDLDADPIYVFNCGLSCQARAPEFFDDQKTEVMLQEAIAAIEYATAPIGTRWGNMRAAAGHPTPFRMDTVEIGNENRGPEYLSRYKRFYEAIKARFPDIRCVANTHVEADGLAADVADEHYYNDPPFFAENFHKYDGYDRQGPEIFVGEYAVTIGHTRNLNCALHEAVFLLGLENNQDIVTLSAYAPLFEHVHYAAWSPNLIRFDNRQSYGIPSYHALSLLGKYRGTNVVESSAQVNLRCRDVAGLCGIASGKPGLQFRNATLDGKPVEISHLVQGNAAEMGGTYTTTSGPVPEWASQAPFAAALAELTFLTLGTEEVSAGTFEVEIKAAGDTPFTLSVWLQSPEDTLYRQDIQRRRSREPSWSPASTIGYCWHIEQGCGSFSSGSLMRPQSATDKIALDFDPSRFNRFKIEMRQGGLDCFLNGQRVQTLTLPKYPEIATVATTSDRNIYLKLVNLAATDQDIEIKLDCDVESEYAVALLTGEPSAENSFADPDHIAPVYIDASGAGRTFNYRAPAMSLNILDLTKK